MNYFVTAIGTDSGKSVISALLAHALGYSYWKPVQAGEPTDTNFIKELLPGTNTYPEAYLLNTPCSPHEAARIDDVQIDIKAIKTPQSENLIIEGAGGVLVPVNHKGELMIDIIKGLNTSCVLVSNTYLGSINHTLLTIEALRSRDIPIKGIVFNGEKNQATEDIILKNTQIPFLFRINREAEINEAFLEKYSPIVIKAFTNE